MNKNLAPHTSNRAACMRDAARTARQRAEETIHSFEADRLRAQSDVYVAEAERLETVAAAADFEVHGRPHTLASAEALLAELEEINASHLGPSDGRVTTIAALEEAIAAHKAAESAARAAKYAAAEERETAERLARNIRQSRAELAGMERGTPGVGRIEYMDESTGKRRVARYETRDGFLRGYIRMASNPNAYSLLFVDEN